MKKLCESRVFSVIIFYMSKNNSPWIHQLARTRPISKGKIPEKTDIVIVGGGIAGISTAYEILKNTDLKVVLLEATKVAHGATGHNAGQITSYFENPFQDFVNKFGLEQSADAVRAIEYDARMILNEIMRDANIKTPLSEFEGYDGLKDKDSVLLYLEDLKLKSEAGLSIRKMYISEEWSHSMHLPSEYKSFYTKIGHSDVMSLLETIDSDYIAALPFLSGCMNSALFTEELAVFILNNFKDRFVLVEESPVSVCELHKDFVYLKSKDISILTDRVVLCTNGFENIKIDNKNGVDIDTKFHHKVSGLIGYMAGFTENPDKKPSASIYTKSIGMNGGEYFYTTRRPYELRDNKVNLISIGGPEEVIEDASKYDRNMHVPSSAIGSIFSFIEKTYNTKTKNDIFEFIWHGLMGYTPNGVRLIGIEPCNPLLLYNLGCNGVGILPSIYGAKRISKILNNEVLKPSIFDPKDQTCPIE
ncbi:MAG: FAD-binding oxidoreductase [Candidatus Pacebacteria bacterium]|nr:FAD-binding oxidoreductase [Candidatus Paceibacterota bacterium]